MIGESMGGRGRVGAMAVAALALFASGSAARADEMPDRKPGLWEVKMSQDGKAEKSMSSRQCIDEKTDKLMREMGKEHEKECSVRETKRQADGVTVHSVCKVGNSTATTDARFAGDFQESYKAEVDVRYDPPLSKVSAAKVRIEAKRLGDCGTMKPGEIEMPDGMKFNVADMGKPGDAAKIVEGAKAAQAARARKR